MALYKPTAPSPSDGSKFYGICKIAIKDFEDLSSKFDWSDVYISTTVRQEGSDYDKTLRITGGFDKDGKGNLTAAKGENRVVNKINHFFGVLKCEAGINMQGEWETYDEKPIKDIAKFLNDKCGFNGMPDEDMDYKYIAYVYKEKSKNGSGKVFTTIYPEIYLDTAENRTKLKDKVNWMKSQGYIKEHKESAAQPNQEVELADAGLSHL